MLEERGIVGPADVAKPREVYAEKADFIPQETKPGLDESEEKNNGDWQKV
jgi:hypothetical protein